MRAPWVGTIARETCGRAQALLAILPTRYNGPNDTKAKEDHQ